VVFVFSPSDVGSRRDSAFFFFIKNEIRECEGFVQSFARGQKVK
jgi:hypothetical protein